MVVAALESEHNLARQLRPQYLWSVSARYCGVPGEIFYQLEGDFLPGGAPIASGWPTIRSAWAPDLSAGTLRLQQYLHHDEQHATFRAQPRINPGWRQIERQPRHSAPLD